MNSKDIKQKYYKVKDIMIKKVNSEVKVELLRRCLKLNVVPKTLRVRNCPPPCTDTDKVKRWNEAQTKGGLELTSEARELELENSRMLRGELRKAETALEDWAGLECWPLLEEKLARDTKMSYKNAQNRTRQRIRLLLRESGKHIPTWLEKSGRSILETSNLDIEQIVCSTPAHEQTFLSQEKMEK